jgi:DNA-binding LacI/PurR family transcriptional regulator
MAAAEKLGYRPNAVARSLASRSSRTFGVLLNDITNPFFAEVYETIALASEAAGYEILMGAGQRSLTRETSIIGNFLSHQVDGLILVSPRTSGPKLKLEIGTTPTVIVGKSLGLANVDCVLNDEYVGARLAIDHLYELGHRRIAHVSGGSGAGASGRKAAYMAAMAGLGLKSEIDVLPGDFTEQAGHVGARALLKRRDMPTAVLAANDLVAVGMISEFRAAGLSVPGDISIVGYDNSMLAGLSLVSLTTVQQPLSALGQTATRFMLERLGGRTKSETLELAPSLVVRDSTSAPRKK